MHPLIRKISHFADISADEADMLLGLFSHEQAYADGDAVFSADTEQSTFFVVLEGWFYSFSILPDGARQIHDVYHAGDVIGLDHLSWSRSTISVSAASDGRLAAAPLTPARRVMFRNPHLSAIFYSLHMLTNVQLLDRITAIARLGAYESLAYFLSDATARRRMISADYPSELYLPLSQKFIADCLGLSAVHVSRQFNKLIENKLLRRLSRSSIQILDEDRLRKISDYQDRYANLDRHRFERELGRALAGHHGQSE
ncbi:Crp/Fnr family transcriptional regulator [Algimonas porphyrae]|uniref:Crp/Fnr family transcriptional regulator n=1 Tax=Algimonas porphyrae TaxID=1128113 RepID=A0ABQ5V2I7_9PROT|nr:Crp/Fnr family transcriptional regulator [Algimonas porphyrae]GLQ20452.1 Crp/Fnr family transcriptional regulator [Algimonas porphyrae]